jgi:hypothetical protein
MVTYPVFLTAFRATGEEPIEVRMVHVPGDPLPVERALSQIFRYGQNDFQPMRMRSVSVGDVIVVGDVPYLVQNVGFLKMSNTEFEGFKEMGRASKFTWYRI